MTPTIVSTTIPVPSGVTSVMIVVSVGVWCAPIQRSTASSNCCVYPSRTTSASSRSRSCRRGRRRHRRRGRCRPPCRSSARASRACATRGRRGSRTAEMRRAPMPRRSVAEIDGWLGEGARARSCGALSIKTRAGAARALAPAGSAREDSVVGLHLRVTRHPMDLSLRPPMRLITAADPRALPRSALSPDAAAQTPTGAQAARRAHGHDAARVPKTGLRLPEIQLHDPWMLADQSTRTYYLYSSASPRITGQGRTGTLYYTSKDLATWEGPLIAFVAPAEQLGRSHRGRVGARGARVQGEVLPVRDAAQSEEDARRRPTRRGRTRCARRSSR